jgi:BON domain
MKSKASLSLAGLAALLALALAVGCTRAPNDAQIANQVQSKIAADANIQNKQINVQSANGVVTLSGTVANDMERTAAGNDAAQIAGVKTVINNLTTSSVAQTAPAAEPPPPEEPPQVAPRRVRPAPQTARGSRNSQTAAARPSERPGSIPVAAPVAAPTPRSVTVPEGTGISIRLIDPIDTERNKVGDTFRATLAQPISVGDEVVIPMGADVEGRIAAVKSAGHYTGQSAVALELVRMSVNGKSYQLRTSQYSQQGASRGKNTAAKVGGGAALGAIIGGIAGGGKGAAIGAGIGAGAGTGVQTVTKGQQIKLASETVLNFNLEAPLNVTPSATRQRE